MEHIKEASDDRPKLATSSDFDNHPAVVAWPPFIWVVEGTYAHGVHHALRREDIVELMFLRSSSKNSAIAVRTL